MSRSLARAAAVANRRVTGLSPAVGPVPGIGWCSSTGYWPPPCPPAPRGHPRRAGLLVRSLPARPSPGRSESYARCWGERGCTVEGGLQLHTLADVVAHLGASGQLGLLDATEVRVRRPAAGRAGRRRFASGKARANTVKALVITDAGGRLLFCRADPPRLDPRSDPGSPGRPGRAAGPHADVTLLADAGYQGLSAQTVGAVLTPRPARRRNQLPVLPAVAAAHEAERRAHSAQRIRVEHGISRFKKPADPISPPRPSEHLDTILRAVAKLLSSQERAPPPEQHHGQPKALTAGTAR